MPKPHALVELMLKLDLLSQPFHFLMPDKKEFYRSFLGSFLTFVTVFIVITFGSLRISELSSSLSYDVNENYHPHAFKPMDPFGTKNGFAVAIGITDYDAIALESYKEDPEIGTLNFYLKKFETQLEFIPIKTRWCKLSDFTFDQTNEMTESGFYPVI